MAFIGNHFTVEVRGDNTLFRFDDGTVKFKLFFDGGLRRGVEEGLLVSSNDRETFMGVEIRERDDQRILYLNVNNVLDNFEYNIGNNDYDDILEYINSLEEPVWARVGGGRKGRNGRKTQKKRSTRRHYKK